MRTEPVVVDEPSSISELKLPDSVMLIMIREHEVVVVRDEDTLDCGLVELDSLIAANGGNKLNSAIALKAEASNPEMLDEVISILKKNGIVRFNLITDMEQ